jgi:CheY-like chemotaxis protein
VKLGPRVLIVDESADSREVLSMMLTRHGATTIEARRPAQAVELANPDQVDLIVCDADSDPSEKGAATVGLTAAADQSGIPIVILGTVPRPQYLAPGSQFLAKPYHYGQLLHKIEDLLDAA